MSFFSDLFHGNIDNLTHDLNPSNAFNDFGSDAMKVLSNPIADVGIGAALLTGGLALPGLLASEGAIDVAGAAGLDTLGGAGGAGLGAGLDTTALGDAGLSDTALTGLEASPGASAFATTQAPSAFDTAVSMGAGGDLSPEAAAAAGIPASPIGASAGPVTASPFGAAPSAFDTGTGAVPFAGATGGVAPPGAVAPAAGGGTDVLSQIGNFMGSPAGKGLGAVAGLGGLGYNLLQGAQQSKALSALNQQEQQAAQNAQNIQAKALQAAQPMLASGTVLSSYIANGTLPPEFQSQLDQIIAAQKAQIRQGYASRSPNDPGAADPTRNSALAQDLASVDQQAEGLKASIESQLASAGNQMVTTANQLLSQGLSATNLSSQIPIEMAKLNQQLNQQVMGAIANFSAALNGRTPGGFGQQGITINTTTGTVQ